MSEVAQAGPGSVGSFTWSPMWARGGDLEVEWREKMAGADAFCLLSLRHAAEASIPLRRDIGPARAPDVLELLIESDLAVGLTFMETGHWVAIDSLIGQYGEGDTCAAAVQDLIVSLFEDREFLRERRDRLMPWLATELDTLEASLRDEML